MSELIRNIAAMQVSTNGEFYAGMFLSFRECGGAPHNYQPDNNIFYTAVSAFALQNMLPKLNGENKKIVEGILQKIQPVYPYYKNKYGYPYYGFWPTNSIIMPHTFFFKYLKGIFGQGEDADDSVIILLTNNSDDSTAAILKKQLIAVSNLANSKRKIISTYKKYRDIPAYSTYLGNRMTSDFDFAVQCNILYFMYEKKLSFSKQDSATVHLLAEMVKNREYMKAPTYLSPYYVHSSILLYHLTRLMGAFKIDELEAYKEQLTEDIKKELAGRNNIMDQIILRTSLLRLNTEAPPLQLNSIDEFENSNQEQFVFFQARAAFSYPTPFKQIFLHWSYIYYLFYCPAYNKVLWLEYLVEKNKKINAGNHVLFSE
ncbi:MAG: hypothetical protein ABJA79_11590 [Parafilimonas sp.]